MASFDKFIICVKGQSCHGSTLEKGVDPVNIAGSSSDCFADNTDKRNIGNSV